MCVRGGEGERKCVCERERESEISPHRTALHSTTPDYLWEGWSRAIEHDSVRGDRILDCLQIYTTRHRVHRYFDERDTHEVTGLGVRERESGRD